MIDFRDGDLAWAHSSGDPQGIARSIGLNPRTKTGLPEESGTDSYCVYNSTEGRWGV